MTRHSIGFIPVLYDSWAEDYNAVGTTLYQSRDFAEKRAARYVTRIPERGKTAERISVAEVFVEVSDD